MIDADYRGNVGVVLFNYGDADFTSEIFICEEVRVLSFCFILVKKGDRIAQLICEKIEMADLIEEQVCFCVSIILIYCFIYYRNLTILCVVQMDLVVLVDPHILPMAVHLNHQL